MEFVPFPKIARYSRDIVITEKIDGTNASIFISESIPDIDGFFRHTPTHAPVAVVDKLFIWAGSRTRWLWAAETNGRDDNFGFAAWVRDNAQELVKLGPGHHFGEWWGRGIQRGYGVSTRRFSLFNTKRWATAEGGVSPDTPACCGIVPILYQGPPGGGVVSRALADLAEMGSQAAPGFMQPEGIVIYHTAANVMFKKTLEKDDQPKSKEAANV